MSPLAPFSSSHRDEGTSARTQECYTIWCTESIFGAQNYARKITSIQFALLQCRLDLIYVLGIFSENLRKATKVRYFNELGVPKNVTSQPPQLVTER